MLDRAAGWIGADEAGRGPLAGPVVAAAVWLPPDFPLDGLDDSKKLTAARRSALALAIRARAEWEIERAEPEEIDRLNILHASEAALARAIRRLRTRVPADVLMDGHRMPPGVVGRAEVKGDGRFAPIAAASILAKTVRDALMVELHAEHPAYRFDRHFGYPVPIHLKALREHGPCPAHRRSFRPVAEALDRGLFG